MKNSLHFAKKAQFSFSRHIFVISSFPLFPLLVITEFIGATDWKWLSHEVLQVAMEFKNTNLSISWEIRDVWYWNLSTDKVLYKESFHGNISWN